MYTKIFVRKINSVFKQTNIFLRTYNNISVEDVPEISPLIIKKLLKANNIPVHDGFASFIISCPWCQKGSYVGTPNIYINKTTGMFLCASCKYLGQWNTLHSLILKKKSKKTISEDMCNSEVNKINGVLKKVAENTIKLSVFKNNDFVELLKKFNLPEIKYSSVSHLDIRIDNKRENIYLPLENVLSETVGYMVLNSETKKESIEPCQNCTGVLTGKPVKNKTTAVIVPHVKDFLCVLNSNVTTNVICLPHGLSQLPQYILPSFERFQKLILWFGHDVASWDTAHNFAKKLGEKRCLFIRPTDDTPLPHLVQKQDLKSIVNAAQPIWHKSITTFASLRQDVLSDLQNFDKVQGVKWKRYPTLNKILKGHRRGELTVITGPTGSGKTTFISDYSLDLAMQGVNTLWGSFEIRNARLAKTMLQQMVGQQLEENLQMFDKWADDFEQLPIYFMTFHGQQTIKIVMEAVEHATYVHDIAHVIIDNVQFMMGITEDAKHYDRFWYQDAIISAFRTFATRKNCHVSLVIHPRKERDEDNLTTNSIFGGAKASQEADNVLILQDKRLTSLRGKKFLQIAKNRYSGELGIMPLEFDKNSLSYAQKKKEKKTGDVPEELHLE